MASYIGDNEPEDLFNEFIYEQLIKTKKKQNMVELISSEDFFNVLEEHEIIRKPESKVEEKELTQIQENIKEFLWLDPQYKDLFMIK